MVCVQSSSHGMVGPFFGRVTYYLRIPYSASGMVSRRALVEHA